VSGESGGGTEFWREKLDTIMGRSIDGLQGGAKMYSAAVPTIILSVKSIETIASCKSELVLPVEVFPRRLL